MTTGREQVTWWRSALILVVARLCNSSSELHIAKPWYPKSALPKLLGVAADRVDDNRLYRTLDQLLPYKEPLEVHLKERMGELFDLVSEDNINFRISGKRRYEVGRLPGQNTRAARLFNVTVSRNADGFAQLNWKKIKVVRDWPTISAGC